MKNGIGVKLYMSKYDNIKDLKNEDFKRLTKVKKETFELMLKYIYRTKQKEKIR